MSTVHFEPTISAAPATEQVGAAWTGSMVRVWPRSDCTTACSGAASGRCRARSRAASSHARRTRDPRFRDRVEEVFPARRARAVHRREAPEEPADALGVPRIPPHDPCGRTSPKPARSSAAMRFSLSCASGRPPSTAVGFAAGLRASAAVAARKGSARFASPKAVHQSATQPPGRAPRGSARGRPPRRPSGTTTRPPRGRSRPRGRRPRAWYSRISTRSPRRSRRSPASVGSGSIPTNGRAPSSRRRRVAWPVPIPISSTFVPARRPQRSRRVS